jgi:flagellar biosynthesis/type III secretory pathway M-ring protein FliF/YscJ
MEHLRRLPFMSGSIAAVLTGIISYAAKADSQTIYIRMAVMMLVFFVLGIYVKNTVCKIKQEADIKKKDQEREEEQRLKKQKEEKTAEALAAKKNASKTAQVIDMTAGDDGQDDFQPLVQAVRTKVKEQ